MVEHLHHMHKGPGSIPESTPRSKGGDGEKPSLPETLVSVDSPDLDGQCGGGWGCLICHEAAARPRHLPLLLEPPEELNPQLLGVGLKSTLS